MSSETTQAALPLGPIADLREGPGRAQGSASRAPSSFAFGVLLAAALALAWAAWVVVRDPPYTSGSPVGYALGVIGGATLLALLLYPVRKHARALQNFGRLKHWFRAHMIGGILGPLLILFHSTFRVGSFNAAVALGCMLLVVASGLAGRFLYRRVHHGLYGRRRTLAETGEALRRQVAQFETELRGSPGVREEVERFVSAAAAEPAGLRSRVAHFALLGAKRMLAWRRIRRTARAGRLAPLLRTADQTLRAAQQAAQFATYERLFALWHVVHVPVLCLLVITALIHVLAVHAY